MARYIVIIILIKSPRTVDDIIADATDRAPKPETRRTYPDTIGIDKDL